MTPPHLTTLLSLLEASCTQFSTTCLDIIVDQVTCDASLLPSVLSVEPPLPWYSPFSGKPEEDCSNLGLPPVAMEI